MSLLTSDDSITEETVAQYPSLLSHKRRTKYQTIYEYRHPNSHSSNKKYSDYLDDTMNSVSSAAFRPILASTSIDSDDCYHPSDDLSSRIARLPTFQQCSADVNSDTSQSSIQSARSQCSCHARSEEIVFTDQEEGYSLVEVHLIPEPCVCSSTCTSPECNNPSPHNCSPLCGNQSDSTILYDWKDGLTDRETETESDRPGGVTRGITSLTDDQLRSCLIDLGANPGPITPSTRRQYELRLTRLRKDPSLLRVTAINSGMFIYSFIFFIKLTLQFQDIKW